MTGDARFGRCGAQSQYSAARHFRQVSGVWNEIGQASLKASVQPTEALRQA